jgi:hypothetical protein
LSCEYAAAAAAAEDDDDDNGDSFVALAMSVRSINF